MLFIAICLLVTLSHGAEYYKKHLTDCRSSPLCSSRCDINDATETCTLSHPGSECAIHPGPVQQDCYCACQKECKLSTDFTADVTCGISKLTQIDEQIGYKIALNTFTTVAGGMDNVVPGVGTLFNVVWGVLKVKTTDSTEKLVNAVRTEVETAISSLESCMDIKISNDNIKDALNEAYGMIETFGDVTGSLSTGSAVGINDLHTFFINFKSQISTLFGTPENNHIEYMGMLPVYLSLYPLYAAVAIERLNYLRRNHDGAMIMYDLENTINNVHNTFKKWILWAKASIIDHINTKILYTPCRNKNSLLTDIAIWNNNFDNNYIINMDNIYYKIGYSSIISYESEYLCLGVNNEDFYLNINGGKIQSYSCYKSHINHLWYYDPTTNQIKNKKGKCLDVYGPDFDSNINEGKVLAHNCNNYNNQKWYIYSNNQIKNYKGKCLEINMNDEFKSIQVSECNQNIHSNQIWRLKNEFPLQIPYYYVVSFVTESSKCLDIYGIHYNTNINGATILGYECNKYQNQLWHYDIFTQQMINKNGKCLDVFRPDFDSKLDGGAVEAYYCNIYQANQKWILMDNNQIKSQNGLCLEINMNDDWKDAGTTGTGGTRVRVSICNGATNQLWKFQAA